MRPTALVVSTVHSSDDTRIRERLIRTLSDKFDVTYATRNPVPSDDAELIWVALGGGRVLRNVRAAALLLRSAWNVAVIHDPELIPAATLTRLVKRRPVVFDVHEDLNAQIEAKEWIAPAFRPVFRWLAKTLYALAERSLILTLAEKSYQALFTRSHVVFPNYPRYEDWLPPSEFGDGSVVYVGDTQAARGLSDAVDACGLAGVNLTVIGPADGRDVIRWREQAARSGIQLEVTGRVPNPESLARIGQASVGVSPLRNVPNYRHSLPTKTLEYLAMGLPVVATGLPGTSEILGSMDAVELVPAGNIEAMSEAIKKLISSEYRNAAYLQASSVRANYAWPSAEVLAFYESLANR